MAETYYVSIAPHNPLGPIATMANIHFAISTPNFLIQEVMRLDVPWRYDVVDSELALDGGYVTAPTRPGIGIEVNEKEAAKHPFQPEIPMRFFHADGSVADW
jgi:galactonate dehydratase